MISAFEVASDGFELRHQYHVFGVYSRKTKLYIPHLFRDTKNIRGNIYMLTSITAACRQDMRNNIPRLAANTKIEVTIMEYWEMVRTKRELAEEFISNPSEDAFERLVDPDHYWASQARSVPHWLATYVFDEQTPDEVADAFQTALKDDIPEIAVELDGFGWPTATEILRALAPNRFAILNDRSNQGMDALGYNPPNPKTASHDQYEAFVDAVTEAYQRFDLRSVVEETTEEPIPDWASHLEIADRAFSDYVEGRVNLATRQPKTDAAPQLVDDEMREVIEEVVEDDPTYRDSEDFVYAAIRAELERARS